MEQKFVDFDNLGGSRRRRKALKFTRPFESPFYKGVQLPNHLKWVTVNAVSIKKFGLYSWVERQRECPDARNLSP